MNKVEQQTEVTFFDAVRENTGKHFLDSGDYYGRHHEQPPVTPDTPAVSIEVYGDEILATIETAHILNAHLDIDQDMQSGFEDWAAENDLSWFEAGQKYMESKGYYCAARGNTYNEENDLSQVYVFEVWHPDGEHTTFDWIYSRDESVTVIYVHTGCDVRGGYTKPYFCRANDEYQIPVDIVCGFCAVEGRSANGGDLDCDTLRTLDEHWQIGYSSCPSSILHDDLERVFTFTKTQDTVCAKLKSGELVKIAAEPRLHW